MIKKCANIISLYNGMTLSQAAEGHLNWKGKNGDLGAVRTLSGVQGEKPLEEVWLPMPPEADDIFCENTLFSTVLRMTYGNDICIHCLQSVHYEMEEKSTRRQPSGIGQTTTLARRAQKVGGCPPFPTGSAAASGRCRCTGGRS